MSEIPAGAMRFNSDSQKLEYWNGSAWFQIHTATPDLATAGDPTPGVRGVYGGGDQGGTQQDVIQYINIASTGDSIDFGDLTGTRTIFTAASSSTRGLFAGGYLGGTTDTNVIEFITISSLGDGTNFGDLTEIRRGLNGLANATRGCFGGGLRTNPSPTVWFNVIDYVTIASTGDAQDFGDLTQTRASVDMGCSSPVRGLFAGGQQPAASDRIDYITIATTGDATDFGNLTVARGGTAGCSNAIKALWGGGYSGNSTIDVVTIASGGNSVKFGDLSTGRGTCGGTASATRGVFAAGNNPSNPGGSNIIDYVEFATEGNAIDFGDILSARQRGAGLSNGHGGL